MTKEELRKEVIRDRLEMRPKVETAIDQFDREQKIAAKMKSMLHSVTMHKTYRTKANNTWHIFVKNIGVKGKSDTLYMVYTLIQRDNGVDCLFIRDINEDDIELQSAHFLKRYKERYLDQNHIDLHGLHPAVYYQLHNDDRTRTHYVPHGWTEEDLKEKLFLISRQGLSLARIDLGGSILTYLTFLDQENLSRYKAMVYEEQDFFKHIRSIKDINDWKQGLALIKTLRSFPDPEDIIRRFFYRNAEQGEDTEMHVKNFMEKWKAICGIDNFYDEKRELIRKGSSRSLLDIMNLDLPGFPKK